MNKKKNRKLALKKQTIQRLSDSQMEEANGGIASLTFTVACHTSNCMTLGEYCVTAGCRLTFGCGGSIVTCFPR